MEDSDHSYHCGGNRQLLFSDLQQKLDAFIDYLADLTAETNAPRSRRVDPVFSWMRCALYGNPKKRKISGEPEELIGDFNGTVYTSSSEDDCYIFTKHAKNGFEKMEKFFLDDMLTDITLITGEKKINAHKLVLCAASDYFTVMFMGNLKEASQSEVVLHHIDGDILDKLIRYCYTGKIELHPDSVESILSTSSLLQLQEVTKACCTVLRKNLDPSNSIGIHSFADREGCFGLKSVAHNYTSERFKEVVRNLEFATLSEEAVFELLSLDDLNVASEEEVFEALMIWIEHQAGNIKNVSKLLSAVRLPLLTPSFITDHVENKPIFRNDPTCLNIIMEAMKFHPLSEVRSDLQRLDVTPRKSTVGVMYAIGGMDARKGATTIEEYNYIADEWCQVGPMSGRRLEFGVAISGNKIFVVGGREGLKALNTVECLNLKTNTWTALQSMATHRHGLGVAILEGRLYAVGGHDSWSYLSTVERWDPDLKEWSFVSSMTHQRSTAGIAVLNNKLYAVGGRDATSCKKSVECYDPHTKKWSCCAQMNKRRGSVGVAVLNGFLYAVGGHDCPNPNPGPTRFECVERYDPKTNVWTMIASLSSAREAVGVGILGSKLLAVGGYDGKNYLSSVDIYDPERDEWQKGGSLTTGRAGTCIVTVPMTLQMV